MAFHFHDTEIIFDNGGGAETKIRYVLLASNDSGGT